MENIENKKVAQSESLFIAIGDKQMLVAEAISKIKQTLEADPYLSAGLLLDLKEIGRENKCSYVFGVTMEITVTIPYHP